MCLHVMGAFEIPLVSSILCFLAKSLVWENTWHLDGAKVLL